MVMLGMLPDTYCMKIDRSGGRGEESCNLLQYSCLENPMDSGVWQPIVHGVTKESDETEQLINHSVWPRYLCPPQNPHNEILIPM